MDLPGRRRAGLKGKYFVWAVIGALIILVLSAHAVFVARHLRKLEENADQAIAPRASVSKPSASFISIDKLPQEQYDAIQQAKELLGSKGQTSKDHIKKSNTKAPAEPQSVSSHLHTFYYAWYGTPEVDSRWLHWDHEVLPHWTASENLKHPNIGQKHLPPMDVGSNYYPALRPYSSADPTIIRAHVEYMRSAGIGVVVLSWWGMNQGGDGNGGGLKEGVVFTILEECGKAGLRVAFHIEPYEGRSALSVGRDAAYLEDMYGHHPAVHRDPSRGNRTVLYIYDSYRIAPTDWQRLLKPSDPSTRPDGVFIGLVVERGHLDDIASAGWDGFYTYFATNGFTYGSTWDHWTEMAYFAAAAKMIFIPCVGPGYIDTNIRPWNRDNIRSRDEGKYYQSAWAKVESVENQKSVAAVAITSFNEWHEGTQIEPAVPADGYMDYGPPGSEDMYLHLTVEALDACRARRKPGRHTWCSADSDIQVPPRPA